jgi:hypothetical protein
MNIDFTYFKEGYLQGGEEAGGYIKMLRMEQANTC